MNTLISNVVSICELAGESILEFYAKPSDWDVRTKSDNSPVTRADLKSSEIITTKLLELTPGIPVLSEESEMVDYVRRQHWERYWLIDPLDGTKEFIEKTDEFTINVALIENKKPILGVVSVPAKGQVFWGSTSGGVRKKSNGIIQEIKTKPLSQKSSFDPLIVVASRRHNLENLSDCLNKLQHKFDNIVKESVGSALKICRIAEGTADIYPRFGPTSEWDTAAGDAILFAAGGQIMSMDFMPLIYNKKSILNPSFFAVGDRDFDWKIALK